MLDYCSHTARTRDLHFMHICTRHHQSECSSNLFKPGSKRERIGSRQQEHQCKMSKHAANKLSCEMSWRIVLVVPVPDSPILLSTFALFSFFASKAVGHRKQTTRDMEPASERQTRRWGGLQAAVTASMCTYLQFSRAYFQFLLLPLFLCRTFPFPHWWLNDLLRKVVAISQHTTRLQRQNRDAEDLFASMSFCYFCHCIGC